LDCQRTRKVGIPTTTVFTCAALIAERRALEELSGGAAIEIRANRTCRLLQPGDALTCYGIIPVLRVTEVEFIPDSMDVKITCVTDYYSCPESEFVNQQAQLPTGPTAVQPDLFSYIELPIWLNTLVGGVSLLALRIRQTANISSAENFISPDDVNFYDAGNNTTVCSGGTLNTGINATDAMEQDGTTPYTFALVGPDVSNILNLSTTPAAWRSGSQIMVIDQEIFFLESITSLGAGQYQLNGVLRARFGTAAAAHGSGANVFIFPYYANQLTAMTVTGSIFLGPQETVYMKDQPIGTQPLALAFVEAQVVNLYGNNVRPLPVVNLRATQGTNGWKSGQDIQLAWDYYSVDTVKKVNTGAGLQTAGEVQGEGDPQSPYFSPPIGKFMVNITDTVGNVKRAFSTDADGFDYTNADLVSDFGSEPAAFIANVFLQSGLYYSPTVSLQVNRY
jgi:hypothetical protein